MKNDWEMAYINLIYCSICTAPLYNPGKGRGKSEEQRGGRTKRSGGQVYCKKQRMTTHNAQFKKDLFKRELQMDWVGKSCNLWGHAIGLLFSLISN